MPKNMRPLFIFLVFSYVLIKPECHIAWGDKIIDLRSINLKIPNEVKKIESLHNVRPVYIRNNNSWELFGHDGEFQEAWTRTTYLFNKDGNEVGNVHISIGGPSEEFKGKSTDKPIFDCWQQTYREQDILNIEKATQILTAEQHLISNLKILSQDLSVLHYALE